MSTDSPLTLLQDVTKGCPPLCSWSAKCLVSYFQPAMSKPNVIYTSIKLSNRECQVLSLIAKGYTLAKVGGLLGITRNTTAGYVKTIYQKLEIHNRAEATMQATKLGLIKVEA